MLSYLLYNPSMAIKKTKLFPEDQAKVDQFLKQGYNDTERREYRPGVLFLVLFAVLLVFSSVAFWVARSVGVV